VSASTVSANASTGRLDSRRWWALAAGQGLPGLTLRPRPARSAEPTVHVTAAGEIEAIGESLGELGIPEEVTAPSA
jgi:hypothetical protein